MNVSVVILLQTNDLNYWLILVDKNQKKQTSIPVKFSEGGEKLVPNLRVCKVIIT